jgi:hypothetical protein
MNVFVSARIAPANVRFPKGFDKLKWEHINTYADYCKAIETNPIGSVVLDSSDYSDTNAARCAKALTEVTCDKKTRLPDLLVVGTDEAIKGVVTEHLAKSKRWIDLNRGK